MPLLFAPARVWGSCKLHAASSGNSECPALPQPTPAKSGPEIQTQSRLRPLTAPLRKRGKVKLVITGTRFFLPHKHTGSPVGPAGPGHNLRPQTLVEMPFRTVLGSTPTAPAKNLHPPSSTSDQRIRNAPEGGPTTATARQPQKEAKASYCPWPHGSGLVW